MWSNQEIIFAQKATAIVKAAGMDPRLLDLEQFRLLAPMIFTRAYCAIYKENQFSLDSDSSKEEVILVSQLVIDGLVAKTRNPVLSMITGFDVFQRNHRAIGILVGLLFDEGQRLWLEKRGGYPQRDKHDEGKRSAVTSGVEGNHDSPREIRKLLNKIDNLEGQMKRRKPKSDHSHHSDMTSNESNHLEFERSSSPKPRKRPTSASAISSTTSHSETTTKPNLRPSSAGTRRIVQQLRENRNQEQLPLPVPPSDPPKSPEQKKAKATGPPNFTYDLKSGRKIPLKMTNDIFSQQNIITNIDQLQFQQNKQTIQNSLDPDQSKQKPGTGHNPPQPVRPEYPGKRIEKSVEEWLKKVQELNRYAADPSYHSPYLENIGVAIAPPSSSSNGVLVYHPIYPLLEEYDIILSIEHCHNCSHHNVSLRHDPKEYQDKAQKMIKMFASSLFESHYCVRLGICIIPADLSCKTEQTRVGAFEVQIAYKSPISQELEVDNLYSKLQTRRWPSKSVVEKRLEAFLNKHQIPRVRSSARDPDDFEMVESRTGSYSYPRGKCDFDSVSISKASWSFDFSVKNDFTEFLYDFRPLLPKDYRAKTTTTSYPSQTHQNSHSNSHSHSDSHSQESSHVPPNNSLKDSAVASLPATIDHFPFSVGEKVFVLNLPFSSDCLEPHPLAATVKRLPATEEDSLTSSPVIMTPRERGLRRYLVQLRGNGQEVEVSEQSLSSQDPGPDRFSNRESPVLGHDLPLPRELEAFLLLLQQRDLLSLWTFPEAADQVNVLTQDKEYSRGTVFSTLRTMVWQYRRATDFSEVFHPLSAEEVVDLHELYSDYLIDWLFLSAENSSMSPKDFLSESFLLQLPKKVALPVFSSSEEKETEKEKETTAEKDEKREEEEEETPPATVSKEEKQEEAVPVTAKKEEKEEEKEGEKVVVAESQSNVEQKKEEEEATAAVEENQTNPSPNPSLSLVEEQELQDKDIVISSVILEGAVLAHEFYDSVFVTFLFQSHSREAKVCLAREKGSKRRSFNVTWDEIPMTSIAFKENLRDPSKCGVTLVLAVMDQSLLSSQPRLPTFSSSGLQGAANACQIPLSLFYKDSFEIKAEVTLPVFSAINQASPHTPVPASSTPAAPASNTSSGGGDTGKVLITINGHAHEAKETRRSRILSMKPVELLKLKFEPLPTDDLSDDEEVDHQTAATVAAPRKSLPLQIANDQPRKTVLSVVTQEPIIEGDEKEESEREEVKTDQLHSMLFSPKKTFDAKSENEEYDYSFEQQDGHPEQDQEDLQKTLFPKPSLHNLLLTQPQP